MQGCRRPKSGCSHEVAGRANLVVRAGLDHRCTANFSTAHIDMCVGFMYCASWGAGYEPLGIPLMHGGIGSAQRCFTIVSLPGKCQICLDHPCQSQESACTMSPPTCSFTAVAPSRMRSHDTNRTPISKSFCQVGRASKQAKGYRTAAHCASKV